MLPYLFDNVTATHNDWYSLDPAESGLSKPYLAAYVALGFANYSNAAPTDIFVNTFYNYATSSACDGSANLSDLYYQSAIVNNTSADADSVVVILTYGQATLLHYGTGSNAITPVLTATYAKALMDHDLTNPLYKQASTADMYQFVPSVPVTLVSLMQDSIVTRKNTDVAFAYFEEENPTGLYKEELVNNADFNVQGLFAAGPVDHTSELPFLIREGEGEVTRPAFRHAFRLCSPAFRKHLAHSCFRFGVRMYHDVLFGLQISA